MNVSPLSFILFLVACGSDKGVTVFNPNPEAVISSHPDGAEVLEGQVITFVGNVSDATMVQIVSQQYGKAVLRLFVRPRRSASMGPPCVLRFWKQGKHRSHWK